MRAEQVVRQIVDRSVGLLFRAARVKALANCGYAPSERQSTVPAEDSERCKYV